MTYLLWIKVYPYFYFFSNNLKSKNAPISYFTIDYKYYNPSLTSNRYKNKKTKIKNGRKSF